MELLQGILTRRSIRSFSNQPVREEDIYKILEAAMKQLFNLPDPIEPLALVALGYPSEIPPQPTDRFKRDRIHIEKW